MKPKVYITRKVPEQTVQLIQLFCDVRMWHEEDIPVPREILEEEIVNVDGLFCLLTEKVDSALMENALRLKIVSNMAVGYNNIDVQYAAKRRIMVTNTPDVLTETTADLTFGLLVATARRFFEASEYLRGGKWSSWSPMQMVGQDVYGTTIGIIGMGRIGQAVARRAKGFGMDILYCNRNQNLAAEQQIGVRFTELHDLLRYSDFVCILVPYTSETAGMIGEKELSLMKSSAILINTSRGGIVDELALYNALVNKTIWAAGLDVFKEEPVSIDHPLLTLPNLMALPHIGSASIQTRIEMARIAALNLCLGLRGETPPNLVNKEIFVKE